MGYLDESMCSRRGIHERITTFRNISTFESSLAHLQGGKSSVSTSLFLYSTIYCYLQVLLTTQAPRRIIDPYILSWINSHYLLIPPNHSAYHDQPTSFPSAICTHPDRPEIHISTASSAVDPGAVRLRARAASERGILTGCMSGPTLHVWDTTIVARGSGPKRALVYTFVDEWYGV